MKDRGRGKGRKKTEDGGGWQTRGQIISMALRCTYWQGLCEWILGFVPVGALKRELRWEDHGRGHDVVVVAADTEIRNDRTKAKCTIPPPVMTVLMKKYLPEWIEAVNQYAQRMQQHSQRQQEGPQKGKQNKIKEKRQQQHRIENTNTTTAEEHEEQKDREFDKRSAATRRRHRREERLALAALRNLRALCHLSVGTAREVLRKVTGGTDGHDSSKRASGAGNKDAEGEKFSGQKTAAIAGTSREGDAASWMTCLLRQEHGSSTPSHGEVQTECLRFVCTLLEVNDFIVLSRLTGAPGRSPRQGQAGGGGGGRHRRGHAAAGADRNVGLAYVALRYGIGSLLEVQAEANNDRVASGSDSQQRQYIAYAHCVTRLLRNARDILLPGPSPGNAQCGKSASGDKAGFVLGITTTVSTLRRHLAYPMASIQRHFPCC